MRKDCRLAPLLLLAGALLWAERADAAGGAFAVDDAAIGDPGECKVESWASFARNHDFIGVVSPACVVKLGVPVELGAQVARQRSSDVWSTSAGIKGKLNIVPVETGRIGVGISAGTAWDIATGTNTGGFINVPLTYEVSKTFRFNVNAGWQHDSVNRIDYATWGAGFEWNFTGPLTLIAEVYGLAGPSTAGTKITSPRAQVGLRLTPVKNIDVDLIYGRNIAGEDSNWVTLGLNLRF